MQNVKIIPIIQLFILLGGIFFTIPLFGQRPLTLDDCLQKAYKNSNFLKIADFSMQSATEEFLATKAQRLPTLSVNSMYTRIGKITSFSIPAGPGGQLKTLQFGTPNRMNLDLKFQMPVFTWGRISSLITLAKTGIELSSLQYKQELNKLTGQVLQAYHLVLVNRKIITLHRENVKRAEKFMAIANERFTAGMVPKLEYLRAQVQSKNAVSALNDALDNLQKSKIFLAKFLGLENESFALSDTLRFEQIQVEEAAFMQRALAVRSELLVFQFQQKMGQSQIQLARSGNKPNLFFFSGYNIANGFDPMDPDRFVENWNAGVQISIPIFDGWKTTHQVQKAKLGLRSIQLQEKEVRTLIKMEVRQALISLKQAENKIMAQQENINLATESLQVTEAQYEKGLVSSLDILNAQRTLAQSEQLHTQALFNHIQAKIELCKAVEDYSWFKTEFTNSKKATIR